MNIAAKRVANELKDIKDNPPINWKVCLTENWN